MGGDPDPNTNPNPYPNPNPTPNPNQVKALKRWDRIAAIRSIASRQANDQHDSQQRFARAGDSRGRAAAGRADLQELAREIWRAQLAEKSKADKAYLTLTLALALTLTLTLTLALTLTRRGPSWPTSAARGRT